MKDYFLYRLICDSEDIDRLVQTTYQFRPHDSVHFAGIEGTFTVISVSTEVGVSDAARADGIGHDIVIQVTVKLLKND